MAAATTTEALVSTAAETLMPATPTEALTPATSKALATASETRASPAEALASASAAKVPWRLVRVAGRAPTIEGSRLPAAEGLEAA